MVAGILRRVQEDQRHGGDQTPSHQDTMAGITGRLRDNVVTIPERYVDPSPESDQEPVADDTEVRQLSNDEADEETAELLDEIGAGHEWPEGTQSFPLVRDW